MLLLKHKCTELQSDLDELLSEREPQLQREREPRALLRSEFARRSNGCGSSIAQSASPRRTPGPLAPARSMPPPQVLQVLPMLQAWGGGIHRSRLLPSGARVSAKSTTRLQHQHLQHLLRLLRQRSGWGGVPHLLLQRSGPRLQHLQHRGTRARRLQVLQVGGCPPRSPLQVLQVGGLQVLQVGGCPPRSPA